MATENNHTIPNTEQLLASLNEAQRAAVTYCDGPALVIAGAGSGKTRVLTYKIAYLLGLGLAPWSIMALTFTNKASREMKERIAALLGDDRARYVWMGTFHSVFLRILRAEHETVGFSSSFTIYDENDSRGLIKTIVRELELDDKIYKPTTVASAISKAKNALVDAETYQTIPEYVVADERNHMPKIGTIYERYAARCKTADAMDFDDILLFTYQLFNQHQEIRQKYVERINYLLVDEYQDTNYAQHQIVRQLTREKQRLCVVGDDAQSIYSFRGANIDNILTFQNSYSDCRLFKLEQNYRSTQTIVNAANSLIHKNDGQIEKTVFSTKEVGDPILVAQLPTDKEEAQFVANQISVLVRRESLGYDDFAVLYRTNAQSRLFEEEFRRRGYPHKIFGGLSFYQRKEIKDMIAYFRLIANHNDEEAFKRIVNYPKRGIGDSTVQKILSAASRHGVSLWNAISDPTSSGLLLSKATFSRLQAFQNLIDSYSEKAATMDVYTLAQLVVETSGIKAEISRDETPEGISRKENMEELYGAMYDFCRSRAEQGITNIFLQDYLNEVSLLSDVESEEGDGKGSITLMTVHSAKGLEFKAVFVVGLEEELFPSQRSLDSHRQMEEERRLFYVAVTRAESYCCLTYADTRYRYGRVENGRPSRFLNDIDERYLKHVGTALQMRSRSAEVRLPWQTGSEAYSRRTSPMVAPSSESSVRDDSPSSPSSFSTLQHRHLKPLGRAGQTAETTNSACSTPFGRVAVGTNISHERFGRGVIEKLEGVGDSAKMTVRFEQTGAKQLLLKFARFEILS